MLKRPVKPVGKFFPNLTVLASYDHATQVTIFNEMDLKNFIDVNKNPNDPKNERDYSIIAHEYRHCVDNLATLWGQKMLYKLQLALGAALCDPIINGEYIIDYKIDEERAYKNALSYNYYTDKPVWEKGKRWMLGIGIIEVENAHNNVNNGKYSVKIGYYNSDGELQTFLPLSIITLLEANAMFDEFTARSMHISDNYKENNDDAFYYTMLENEYINASFVPDMSVYTAMLQVTTFLLNSKQAPSVGRSEMAHLSSLISTLALNLPADLVRNLPVRNDSFFGKFGVEKIKNLLANQDYGFIFCVLCQNYGEVYIQGEFGSYLLDDLLMANNLPNKEHLQLLIEQEMLAIGHQMGAGRFAPRFVEYSRVGLSIFRESGLDGYGLHSIYKLDTARWVPPYSLKDGGVDYDPSWIKRIHSYENDTRNAMFWYNAVSILNDKMEKYYKEHIY